MKNIRLKYAKKEHSNLVETTTCRKGISLLKSKLRDMLSLKNSQCLLINAISIDNCDTTIIMIECYQTIKMKIYSINKHPSYISEEDIKLLEQKHYRPCVKKISLV